MISFAAVIGTWITVSLLGLFPHVFLPSPVEVIKGLSDALFGGKLMVDLWSSLWRVMAGFLAGAILAVAFGLFMGNLKSAEALLRPLTEFLRYMPVPAFLPLCILWFGIGELEKVVVIFLGTFFQLVILVSDASRAVPDHLLEIGYTLGLGRMQSLWRIVLPGALPKIFDNLRVSFGWAWSYVVVAEIVAANRGLGFMIMQNQRFMRTAEVIGGILVIGLLGLASDLTFRVAATILFPYKDSMA